MLRITAFSDLFLPLQNHPEGLFDDRLSMFTQHREHGKPLLPDADGVYRTNSMEVFHAGEGPLEALIP